METRSHHLLIGIFTLLAVAAIITFTLWLSKNSADKKYDLYDIVFSEAISGLNKGGIVEFNGIRIGQVVSLRFDTKDAKKVIARVSVESSAPIRSDTEAKLMSSGITGVSVIRLMSGNQTNSILLSDDDGIPVIIASPSPLSKLLSNGEDVLTSINEVLIQTRQLMSQENLSSVKQTLSHIEQSTAMIAKQEKQLNQLLENMAHTSVQAQQTLAAAAQLMSTSHSLLDQQGKQLLIQTNATLAQAQQSLAVAETSLLKVSQTMSDNKDNINASITGMTELGPTLVELKNTLQSIRQITQQLEQNPSSYLFNSGRIQEFQP